MIKKRKNQPQNQKENAEDNVAAIKLIREELGLTQAQFAVALGIDTSTVSRAERGVSEPSFTILQIKKLCQMTGRSPLDFPDYFGKK
jgi:putative transcriptional regulator